MTGRVPIIAVAGVLGVVALMGFLVSFDRYVTMVVAAVLLLVGPLVLAANLRSSDQGLALLILVAVLLPFEMATGEETRTGVGGKFNGCVLVVAFLCAVWFLRLAILRRRIALDPSRLSVATLVFMISAVLSFVVGQFPWFSLNAAPMKAQLGGLALFLLSGGILLLVGHEVQTPRQLERLTWLFIGLGGLSVLAMLVPGSEITVGPVAVMAHGSVGSLFFTWLVAMSAGQALFNQSLSPAKRTLLLAVAGLALGRGLLLTFSWASGWLPPLIALGVVLLIRFPRLTLATALLIAAPALFVSGLAWDSLMKEESWSWMTRLEAWRAMGQVIERNPLLGLGPANYRFYTRLFPIVGWSVRFNSHNNYIDLLAQTGVVGLAAFIWFAFEAVRLAMRLVARLPAGFGRAYAVGALGGLAGSLAAGMLADWIVPFLYNIGITGFRSSVLFWVFLGGLLALRRMTDAAAVPARAMARPAIRELAATRA